MISKIKNGMQNDVRSKWDGTLLMNASAMILVNIYDMNFK